MVAWFFRSYRVVYGHRNFIITVITKGQDVKVTVEEWRKISFHGAIFREE